MHSCVLSFDPVYCTPYSPCNILCTPPKPSKIYKYWSPRACAGAVPEPLRARRRVIAQLPEATLRYAIGLISDVAFAITTVTLFIG